MVGIEEKYEFFRKPKSKKDIIGDRTLVNATKYDLAERVRNLAENQAIVLDQLDPEQRLIDDRYKSSEDFLKHGPKVFIDSSKPMWMSREEEFSGIHNKKQQDSNYFAEFAGITWKPDGIDKRSRIVHLVDCVEAVMIYHYLANSRDFYEMFDITHEARPSKKGMAEGANYCIDMSSRSEVKKDKVAVTLKHIPFSKKGDPAKVVSGLDAMCDCKYFRYHNLVYEDRYSGRKSPLFLDMHAIAAYLSIIDKNQKELDRFIKEKYGEDAARKVCAAMETNPFPLPTQTTLNDYLKFERQVMIRDVARDSEGKLKLRKDGNPRIKHRKTNRAEKELFLVNYIAAYGEKTFFATKRLRDYEINY